MSLCAGRELSREVPPEVDTPERIVKQEDGLVLTAGQIQRLPASGKQCSPLGGNPGITGCQIHFCSGAAGSGMTGIVGWQLGVSGSVARGMFEMRLDMGDSCSQ